MAQLILYLLEKPLHLTADAYGEYVMGADESGPPPRA